MKALVIRPVSGQKDEISEHEMETLEELQAAVDGWIEPVTLLPDQSTMYVNEEFLFRELPFNETATVIAALSGRPDLIQQGVYGSVVIVGPLDKSGDDTDVTDRTWRLIKAVLAEAG